MYINHYVVIIILGYIKMAHPEWALKYKVKNTELRKFGDKYYLYSITSKWDPEKKRTILRTVFMYSLFDMPPIHVPGQSPMP